jgi:hypothetical protein
MSQLWNLVPSLLVFFGVLMTVWWLRRGLDKQDATRNIRPLLGPYGLEAVIGGFLLLWVVPWGVFIVLPALLLVSALSPAGREDWRIHRRARVTLSTCLITMILLGGLVPVGQPIAPAAWGEPLLQENPNAPVYPASEQYTWLMLPEKAGFDVEIVQSISMRLPYQYGTIGASSSALDVSQLFGMENGRMRQAIELLDQQITGASLDPDEMDLKAASTEESHRYISTALGVDERVEVRVFELRSLLSTSSDGTQVGEVLCVAKANLGGELQMLIVVRPILHPGLSSDRFAESLVLDWLAE